MSSLFQWFFKYPASVFTHGQWVLMGPWPRWLLTGAIVAAAAALGWRWWRRLAGEPGRLRSWRGLVLWALQLATVALLLLLIWQPAVAVSELKPQQNIIAVLIDDSRSMATVEHGSTREAAAVKAVSGDALAGISKQFQVRFYSIDDHVSRVDNLARLQPTAPATRLNDGLQQFVEETADLPVGAVVLLSDGGDNTGGIDRQTVDALRSRHIPVHTIGFGDVDGPPDVEVDDVLVAPRTLVNSRLAATVSFHQHGYEGQSAVLTVSDGDRTLASRTVKLGPDNQVQSESILFNAGDSGARTLRFALSPMPGEVNRANNAVSRLVNVEPDKQRVLYVEGEPRWEYKFIRRAEEGDQQLQLSSMLRTTENKILRQGISDPSELADGFPSQSKDLYVYQGLIVGSVAADYFTPDQQLLIRDFVDKRGGGLLLLGGRSSLGDGGWAESMLAPLLPVTLPSYRPTYQYTMPGPGTPPTLVSLTRAGADSIITRLVDDRDANIARWQKLPALMDYQDPGTPKPGATVLAEMTGGGKRMPLLITQNYGRGRVAVLATSGTWRWQMFDPLGDPAHDMFWRQLIRWLVTDTPGHVLTTAAEPILFDHGEARLMARVRDQDFNPAADAEVQGRISGPGGSSATVDFTPVIDEPGAYQAEYNAGVPGTYLVEVTATRGGTQLGRDVLTFQRMDGVAENFHTEQNRDLLQKLAAQTGGQYWRPNQMSTLAATVPFSTAGLTVRNIKEIWNMPAIFLLLILLRVAEWLLRRKWGAV